MLHVYYGTDRQAVRDAANFYIDGQLPADGTLTTLDVSSYEVGQLADALGATSLFGGAEWYLIDSPSDSTDFNAEVSDNLAAIAESHNMFIVLEGALLATAKKSYSTHASVCEEFTAAKAERFNTFGMADALAARDRRKLWVLLQEAKLEGLLAEEIIGVLWWQLKTLRLAELTTSAAEAGIKDFPYNKAKRALAKFQPGEVSSLSHSLLSLYHDGHAGVRDIDTALEYWVLSGK